MKLYKSLVDYIKLNNLENIKVTNDCMAWVEYPEYNFIYNKLWLANSQDIEAGPMGVYPISYPVIFKPIINLFGMSRGFKIINNEKEYNENIKDGFFWEKYLDGKHNCIDLIIQEGEVKFVSALESFSDGKGGFIYHTSIPDFELPEHIIFWLKLYFGDYTGCLNIETINGLIIEGHLRLNGDFHLYNLDFAKHLNSFYFDKKWSFNFNIKKTYLLPIFVKKEFKIENLDNLKNKIIEILGKNNIETFYQDDINSNCQSEWKSRLFMFEIKHLNFELIKKIKKL